MSAVDTATSFKDLEDGLKLKISELKIYSNVRGGWGKDTIDELKEYVTELFKISQEIESHKTALQVAKCQIIDMKELFSQIDNLSGRLSNIKNNLPSHVPAIQVNNDASANLATADADKPNLNSDQNARNCQEKRSKSKNLETLEGKPEKTFKPVPKVEYITLSEYESVPKYTKGRIPYSKVNSVIDEINKSVEAKYNLMRKPRPKLTPIEMSMVASYKQQTNQDTKGLYFVVDEDLKKFSNLKMDTSGRNVLTILRTLKRLKEVRGPGSLLRYCIFK